MATSSILGGSAAPQRPRGTGTDLLGPSDSSDTGSDVQGERAFSTDTDGGAGAVPAELDSDTDSSGTGERAAATGTEPREGGDIMPDRVLRTGDALDDTTAPVDVDDLVLDDEPELDDADADADERDATRQ